MDAGGVDKSLSLTLAGFTGPLDRLLALARTHQLDLAGLSLSEFCTQVGAALQQARFTVPLSQRCDWLAMGAWVILLRSRLLLPAAEIEAAPSRSSDAAEPAIPVLVAWLERRPQLGRTVFARGRPEWAGMNGGAAPSVDVIEFLWASLVLFDSDLPASDTAPRYRPVWLDLHSVADALERIGRRLQAAPDGGTLASLLPEPTRDAPPVDPLRRRSAWSSTFVAGLELAKQGAVTLTQTGAFEPIHVSPAT